MVLCIHLSALKNSALLSLWLRMTKGALASHQALHLGKEVCKAQTAAEAGEGSAVVKWHRHFHGFPLRVKMEPAVFNLVGWGHS